jgi:hypothetical protein
MSKFYTINGIMYDEYDKVVEIEEYGDEEYKQFRDEFESKTYLRLCIEQPLNTIISSEENIVIYDNRSNCYEYSDLPKSESHKYINYLHIRANNHELITLKQILTEIMNCDFYSVNNKEKYEYFNHVFLENITRKQNTIHYELWLGS